MAGPFILACAMLLAIIFDVGIGGAGHASRRDPRLAARDPCGDGYADRALLGHVALQAEDHPGRPGKIAVLLDGKADTSQLDPSERVQSLP